MQEHQDDLVRRRPDEELFAAYRRTRDTRVRDELVRRHLGLALRAARRFGGRGVDDDDLCQVASIALLQAVERFDPDRGTRFSTFALPTIVGTLKRHLRDHAWHVRPPRGIQERVLAMACATEELTGELRRAPTVAEIAAYGGWTDEQVLEATHASGVRSAHEAGLEAAHRGRDEAATDGDLGSVDERVALSPLISMLDDREKEIVRLRFYDDLRQTEISRRVGLSEVHVRRLLAESLGRLRAAAQASPPRRAA